MSKVGKRPVSIPSGVEFSLNNSEITLSSKGRKILLKVPEGVEVLHSADSVSFSIKENTKFLKSLWGTFRAIVNNSVNGLLNVYTKKLELVGVGYKASVSGKKVNMQLAYSHDISVDIPDGIEVKAEKPTTLIVSSYDKQKLGAFLKVLQAYRKPEPYKGKGIIIENQYVYRKEGKKK